MRRALLHPSVVLFLEFFEFLDISNYPRVPKFIQYYHNNAFKRLQSPCYKMTTSSNVKEIEGDLFAMPEGTALIHACNCKGTWGGGIAKTFYTKYPAAFKVYQSFCADFEKNPHYLTTTQPSGDEVQVRLPEGHALIIPPQPADYEKRTGKKHWIICLFTSYGYGLNVSSPAAILRNTETALADLKTQLRESQYAEIAGLYACQINSVLFKVDWNLTKQKMEQAGLNITVVSLPS